MLPNPEDGVDDLALLAAFEPVVRLTQGEYFVPVGVEDYVRQCSLWRQTGEEEPLLVASPGELGLDSLAAFGLSHGGPGYSLSGISVQKSLRHRIRSWFTTKRPRFRAGARLAEVGLTGRAFDTLSRVSLLFRGAVPGGSAVASLNLEKEHLHPERPTYHARVLRDGPWIVCQYWFFYSFNNWRSGFSGVNEHEADWEQVTIYLDGTGVTDEEGLPIPRWVVFSAHDEVGDDLRRRWDDPDLTVVGGRHPVVFAGAGSHSGAYLAGDYLITVVPPRLGGLVPAIRRMAKVLTPWTRAAQGSGLGIPYIDYARGDGVSIGPDQQLAWTRVVIDDETPWVRDYRGLWGHDTRDRFGGERGPAGPRYERNATVRASWGDPVGWAGLAKAAPNPTVELELVAQRIDDIDVELARLSTEDAEGRTRVAEAAAGLAPDSPEVRGLQDRESVLLQMRMTAVRLQDERQRMERALADGLPDVAPHAHLTHRRLPLSANARRRNGLLSAWSVISTPLILLLIASLFLPQDFSRPWTAVAMLVAILAVEAFARGYFLAFIVRVLLLFAIVNLAVAYFNNWQFVSMCVFAALAVIVLIVNIRDAVRG